MKKILLATVLTLMMLSPVLAADVRFQADPFLVASNQNGQGNRKKKDGQTDRQPPMLIIKGKGGKVTGVQQEPPGPRKKK
ncbi:MULTISPECIES: hypothetical protein [unclassified Pseudodesulfovibrio]|uniref:hypothetical protein n=1 Tax=unclassified Pseudodesulfovibrio TaxID=2661612 RepID=UPI000FEC1ADD|nr:MULTISPECIES: hypothetical protein [unclassified Pseudodesulfovibrio]MCJ2164456.1 hypothetical protein [Pseudodesulfovibrio sp. S3-i]RWU04658.1 hypothetical protein DWB63_07855 [Pseudodesulfovibrio sp. S3]